MTVRRGVAALLFGALLAACGGDEAAKGFHSPAAFVIGFDGMKPEFLEAGMESGQLPNFARLAKQGGYARLGTTLPPETPVAWASFITGKNPGGHGIYDFVHRDITADGISLYLATSKSEEPSSYWWFLGYRLPSPFGSPGGTTLLVKGKYFWEYLVERDIPATIFRVPSNYPPKDVGARTFPGVGTPDVLGSYGVFTYFTDDPPLNAGDMSSSAEVMPLEFEGDVAESVLKGPRNSYEKPRPRRLPPQATVPVRIYRDAERGVARIDIDEETVLLRVGEWSDWVQVEFPMIPNLISAHGIVRLYLKEVSPHFRLYVSPVNIDPLNPDLPVSTPPEASVELAEAIGRYYTQGMAEETQANRYGVFTTDEFLAQAEIVLEERRKMLDYELERFCRVGGLTFFYFSTTDLCAHMLYRYMDEDHPFYDPEGAKKYGGKVMEIYREMDRLLGKVMDAVPPGTRIAVLSDHGFQPYRRQLNLNSWLCENGYLSILYPARRDELGGYKNVDWYETQAYAVGFSGIYLNLMGREATGTVKPGKEAEKIKQEIIDALEALVDPETGEKVVTKVYRREEAYHGAELEHAPDLVVGFNRHHGCADDSVSGVISRKMFRDTDDAWAGSHLTDPRHVPGILVTNAKLLVNDPELMDLPVSILRDFGIQPEGMDGRPIW